MNFLFLVVVLIATVIIFGLPLWNLALLKKRAHPLWWIVPPVLFLILFASSNFFEAKEFVWTYRLVKNLAYMWLIVGMMLFGASIAGMLVHLAFKTSKKLTFWLIVGATLFYAGVAWINGQRVVVKDLVLPAENIVRDYHFVHITDLHNGSTDRAHAQVVVDKIKPLDPEFVVITGDFIDEFFVETYDIDPFTRLDMPIYLITGNHEYYLPDGKIQEVIEGTDIQLIDGMKISFEELDIVGVNELATVESTLNQFGGVNPNRYTILLDHQPKTDEVHRAESSGVQLMLSGHTHKGQVWPMSILMKLQFIYIGGLYEIGDMFLYVNQGTGTLGPKMRVGSANEITYITLESITN